LKASDSSFPIVTHYRRNLRGGSQPILAQASDGLLYVLKFTNNLQGPNLSFNESTGTDLFRACGLSVPAWKPLLITDSFLDNNRNCWLQTQEGSLRPASGLCFGSQFIGSDGGRILEILPGSSFQRVINHAAFWTAWLIDICAEHADHRQAIFTARSDGWSEAIFIDHGHMLGGPEGKQRKSFRASRYLDERIYRSISVQQARDIRRILARLDANRLWQMSEALPDEWKTVSAREAFARCLNRLATASLLRRIFDAMIESRRQSDELDRRACQPKRNLPFPNPRSGIRREVIDQKLYL
jgi:hypothetical protein